MNTAMNLQQVLQRPDVWRGGYAPPTEAVSSGFPILDRMLPGGGWPVGALVDIEHALEGVGELRLVLPALARLSSGDRWIALIAPPYVPYAPTLARAGVDLSRLLLIHPRNRADHLWALEHSLRSGACAAVLAWVGAAEAGHLRRLQLAAEAGGATGFLFQRRPIPGSPAALRLGVTAAGPKAVDVRVLKRRGGWPTGPVQLEVNHALAMPVSAKSAARYSYARRAFA